MANFSYLLFSTDTIKAVLCLKITLIYTLKEGYTVSKATPLNIINGTGNLLEDVLIDILASHCHLFHTFLYSCSFAVIMLMLIYRIETKCRCQIQRMSQNDTKSNGM